MDAMATSIQACEGIDVRLQNIIVASLTAAALLAGGWATTQQRGAASRASDTPPSLQVAVVGRGSEQVDSSLRAGAGMPRHQHVGSSQHDDFSTSLFGQILPARRQAARQSPVHSHTELTSAQLENDPFAPVYIVTSRKTHDGIRSIARDGSLRRDSVGTALMLSEIKAHQLSEVSEYIHTSEQRCGGYFAFESREEADDFIRADRAAAIAQTALAAQYTIDNQITINPWLSQVNETNIYNTINHLSSYPNRYYASPTGKSSAEWIRNTWQSLAAGRTDVTTELFTACGNCSTQPSVILTIQGTDLSNEIVVLGGHLDSINSSGNGNPNQIAPGADDDASGIATLTEILRVSLASGWRPKRTVKFMGYAAEEVGLRGSNAIAQSFRSANRNVVGVLQLDMTNYKSGAVPDMRLITDFSNADLKTFVTQLFDAYLAPRGLTRGTSTCGYACSDHASWTSAGYPAAMMFEAGDPSGYFPFIHTTGDTLANMGESAQHSVKFAQLGLAFLGEMGKSSKTWLAECNLPPFLLVAQ